VARSKKILIVAILGLLSAGAIAQRGGRFAELDKNGDGVLQRGELSSSALFDKLDADHDGSLTRLEALRGLAAARAAARHPVPEHLAPGMKVSRDVAYGDDPLQALDVYSPAAPGPHPIVVMVHGGGWSRGDKSNPAVVDAKSHDFVNHGYVFISANYRLVPQVTPVSQAEDLAAALAFVKAHATEYGGDPRRMVLMGHSAGAHLSALVATDPNYLRARGLEPASLSGVVLLDGAAYNLPEGMQHAGLESGLYEKAFGDDQELWKRCSPTLHVGEAPLPPFLIVHAGARETSRHFSEQLAKAVTNAGGEASLLPVPDKGHAGINGDIGTAGDTLGPRILKFTDGVTSGP
jgi:acetyl esterase/lipase